MIEREFVAVTLPKVPGAHGASMAASKVDSVKDCRMHATAPVRNRCKTLVRPSGGRVDLNLCGPTPVKRAKKKGSPSKKSYRPSATGTFSAWHRAR